MVATNGDEVAVPIESNYDRATELKAFDDAKTGVKGLVDAGITKIPRMFISPPDILTIPSNIQYDFPIIDLDPGLINDLNHRQKIIGEVRNGLEKWGLLNVINYGFDPSGMEDALKGVQGFFEQDDEMKKAWYTRDVTRKFVYNSNMDLYTAPVSNWRDTFICFNRPDPSCPEELPQVCRDMLLDFTKKVMTLGDLLYELISEALGLEPRHLKDKGYSDGMAVVCHYYPPCPQPELTLGTSKHSDKGFLTVLLHNQIKGLQVVHENQWVDIPLTPESLTIITGDVLQLISNDRFKSFEHRVLANHGGPRVSLACTFRRGSQQKSKVPEPIKDLLSEDNPPIYRETTSADP